MNSVKIIKNNRLTVEIAEPDKYNFTDRFDRYGFITQVILDGKDSFCGKEPEGCTDGVGICNEFNISDAIGYEEVEPGEKPITIEEYCHNFLSINHHKVCEDYQLYLPYKVQPLECSENIVINNHGVTWKNEISETFYMKTDLLDKSDYKAFELKHEPSGLSVAEENDFYATRFAVWGAKDVISPEVFINLVILPGEFKSFNRSFKFSSKI